MEQWSEEPLRAVLDKRAFTEHMLLERMTTGIIEQVRTLPSLSPTALISVLALYYNKLLIGNRSRRVGSGLGPI